ncbi:hypothetical protein [Variovorax sp. tm]|uniref:hypothetical protein n=1 Tax=Variovorax atrisoli TaxID=3394203 RepID=UPI003A7F78A5
MKLQRTGHRYRDVETGKTIDVWFPRNAASCRRSCLAEKVGLISGDVVEVMIDSLSAAPISTEDAYLRLHLLSERMVKPNEVNLDGVFGLLLNVAWTSAGWAAAGFKDTLLGCEMKLEVGHGNEKAIQPRVQA